MTGLSAVYTIVLTVKNNPYYAMSNYRPRVSDSNGYRPTRLRPAGV